MQYNDESTDQGILQDITFWTGADKGTSDADSWTAYTLKDRTRNCNFGLDRLLALVLRADQRWKWDDTNNTDLPIGQFNIVSGQRDYGITGATYLKILKVVIKDSGGVLHELSPIDIHSPEAKALNEKTNTGTPKYYDLHGNSLWLEPCPNYASTLGGRIYFQRNVSYFLTSDTTKAPGFAQPFHRLISLYASEDYLAAKGLMGDRLRAVQNMIVGLETSLIDFYASRNQEDKPRLRMRREDYGENHLKGEGGGTPSNQNQAIHW